MQGIQNLLLESTKSYRKRRRHAKSLYTFLCVLAVLVMGGGCKAKIESTSIPDLFERSILISGEKVPIKGLLGMPIQILAHDSLIFINEYRDDQLLYVYNAKTGNLLAKTAHVGRGPNEFSPPIMISFSEDREKLNIYDRSQKHFGEYQFSEASGLELIGERIHFNADHSKVHKLDDTMFLSDGFFHDGRFCISDKSKDTLIYRGEYPDMDLRVRSGNSSNDKLDNNIKEMIFQGQLEIRPDLQYFVICSSLVGILEIYEIQGGALIKKKEIRERDYVDLDGFSNGTIVKADISPTFPRGFSGVFVTQEHIFTLYSGRSEDEFPYNNNLGSTILVFDWQGNPILRFDVNEELKSITLDSSSNKLYAIYQSEEIGVITYDLNEYITH